MTTPESHKELLNFLLLQDKVYSSIYNQLASDLSSILRRYKITNKSNVWHKNPEIKKELDKVLSNYRKTIFNNIQASTATAWELSEGHNDNLVKNYTKGIKVPEKKEKQLYSRNNEALAAFQNRVQGGMKLSDRVWNLTDQTKTQLEAFISEGLTTGRSASSLASDLKRYLKEPERRFRRLKDPETGKLILSDPAKKYNPGRGVYRSSYKNALRLARNEINIAYRTADIERRKNLPFVLGIKVNLSPAHPQYDICDELAGEYPKDFNFVGWHPNCLCFTTTKLLSQEDFVKQINGQEIPSSKYVNTIPATAAKYLKDNVEKLKGLSNTPYFIKDNFKLVNGTYKLKDGSEITSGAKTSSSKNTISKEKTSNSKKETNKIEESNPFIPDGIDNYEKETGVEIDRSIFTWLTKKTTLRSNGTSDDAYYRPSSNMVNANSLGKRNQRSKWQAKSVIYHEFGHAADWHSGFRGLDEVKNLMNKYRKEFRYGKELNYRSLDDAWRKKAREYFYDRDFDKFEQAGSFADTLMSLNSYFGAGHTKKYYKSAGMKEAEFIAHAFENKFSGNEVFKELAPDLYEDMIKMVDLLKTKLK